MSSQQNVICNRGTRKSSVAVTWLKKGSGQITVRTKSKELPISEYFKSIPYEMDLILKPIALVKAEKSYDILCRVRGGGIYGQAEALQLAIAKSLAEVDKNFRDILRFNGMLTTDSRKVESKKAGQLKARKSPTFNRR